MQHLVLTSRRSEPTLLHVAAAVDEFTSSTDVGRGAPITPAGEGRDRSCCGGATGVPFEYLCHNWKDFFFSWKSSDGKIQCQRFYHAFTKGELKRLFKKLGFKVEKIFTHLDVHKKEYGRGVNVVSIVKK